MADADWKKRLGFDINYSSSQSSEEDDITSPTNKVVEKKYQVLDDLAAEYDHLSSTPPRTRIRNKEKHRSYNVHDGQQQQSQGMEIPKPVPRRNTTDNFANIHTQEGCVENKRSKRRSLKLLRVSERDLKLDIGKCKNCGIDCPPPAAQTNALQSFPTLVESCNRFLSLSSRPVPTGREQSQNGSAVPFTRKSTMADSLALAIQPLGRDGSNSSREDSLDSRAIFHSTFSMLIRMGNVEKNNSSCKRAMSVEEHTWQNELKDLVWLEVCAKRAGRTPTQQDAFLCARRDEVPTLLQEILDFKFKTNESCSGGNSSWYQQDNSDVIPEERFPSMCLDINCPVCCRNIGEAMKQVIGLLDALAEAEALYPSTKAMALHHPIILQQAFIDKTKAMCLWFNMVRYQRLSLIIIRKLLMNHRWRTKTDTSNTTQSVVSASSGVSSTKNQKVTFTIESTNTTDTSSSGDGDSQCTAIDNQSSSQPTTIEQTVREQSDDETDSKPNVHIEITRIQSNDPLTFDTHDRAEGFLKVRSISQEVPKSPYDSADSSSGSVNSTESGFVSSAYDTHEDQNFHGSEKNLFDLGDLSDLTKLRLFYPNQPSPYRDYLEKVLKSSDVRRALYFLEKIHSHLLRKTRMTLEKYEDIINNKKTNSKDNSSEPNFTVPDMDQDLEDSDDDFELEQHERCHVDIGELRKEHLDLRRYGAWCKETLDMELPSYRSAFLYLSTIPMENIHEFLSMKLETKPDKPSVLSIKQLIGELRDGLTIAVRVRARFIRHIQTALLEEQDNSPCRIVFNRVLETFEKTLDNVYKLYLSYLSDWAGVEHLPRATLAAEWAFNCYLARSLRPAARLSPLTFCCLTVRQLNGAADRLKTRVAELGKEANRIKLMKQSLHEGSHDTVKWRILTKCRVMQCLLTEERERIISTSQFARTVSMHLHYNSIFRDFRQKIYKAMSDVRDVICWLIKTTEETTSPKRLAELEDPDKPSVQSRTREIVSQAYKFGFEFHKEMCRLINDTLSPECLYNACARNSLSQNRRSKLIRSESISENHVSLEDTMFFLNTPTITNQEFQFMANGNPRMNGGKKMKEDSFSRCLYKSGYKHFQRNFLQGTKFPSFDSIASGISLADLNYEDFKNGIPGCDDCNKVKDSKDEADSVCLRRSDPDYKVDWEENVSRSLVTFSKQWMNFAMQRCERGRGLRPRWASHGLEFLMLTCDPQHTKHLSDAEFEELKVMMDSCISHVIGTAGSGGTSAVGTPTLTMPTPQRTRTSIHYPQHPLKSMASSPPSNQEFQLPVLASDAVRVDKKMIALCDLDNQRDASLRKAGVIGCVRQGLEARDSFRPRPVTFKWQRGIKIGQGRFGKVYTVVNTETGSLLAMKEVSLALGDRRAVERAAHELKILEGVVHANLVQYYGVEIHREEMLIFMELCVEGSLEALIADTCVEDGVSGLPEPLVRKYTRQLVSAIRALHMRSIAHRDIKSGNIFLTEEGNCLKLGDFGCAVKIRANTTVPGELQGYVGTQAYMAPEVFMKSSGHGRGADIWSLGSVVVEMASGKRPWSEYDSNYQIMFVVGMGGRPEPPSTLSAEGIDFCYSCLQHDVSQRATIDTLSHHHFVKTHLHEDF